MGRANFSSIHRIAGIIVLSGTLACHDGDRHDTGDGSLSTDAPDGCPIDVPLGEVSVAADWPLLVEEPTPGDLYGPETDDPGCILSSPRLAVVEIDAIVRDYSDVSKHRLHYTVYRLRVLEILSGEHLPEVVYGAAQTGRVESEALRYSQPSAQRRVGWQGLAFMSAKGIDPIRMVALSWTGASAEERIVPARVLRFGHFMRLTDLESGTLDLAELDDEVIEILGGHGLTLDRVRQFLADVDRETCFGYEFREACGACSTSQTCSSTGADPWPCKCHGRHVDCTGLPPEDPLRSCLYDPSAQTD